ncbi:hypothetical protein KGM_214992 [Danaus plexippus plexippus]|uniref:Uncharacterized protein n=1 Tax=Danaus plexippus plexippus TaxID=278856 RepID=A0A212EYP8_DANPL|nr:hypothetical protein KGM_214992 [Danaus plexippus plexippus]
MLTVTSSVMSYTSHDYGLLSQLLLMILQRRPASLPGVVSASDESNILVLCTSPCGRDALPQLLPSELLESVQLTARQRLVTRPRTLVQAVLSINLSNSASPFRLIS